MDKKELPIIYGNWGIANQMGDHILMHKKLQGKEWQELHDWILLHELKHQPGGLTWEDFKLDVVDTVYKPQDVAKAYFKFFFSTPTCWVQILPFWVYKGKIWIEWQRVWSLVFYCLVSLGGWFFIKWLIT